MQDIPDVIHMFTTSLYTVYKLHVTPATASLSFSIHTTAAAE